MNVLKLLSDIKNIYNRPIPNTYNNQNMQAQNKDITIDQINRGNYKETNKYYLSRVKDFFYKQI